MGGQAAEQRVLEERDSQVVPAHEHVSTAAVRRSAMPDGQLRQHFIVPPGAPPPDAPGVAVVVASLHTPLCQLSRFIRSGTTRGPPVG